MTNGAYVTTCLGVITARGGSKGVPRKNIRSLNGRSAIEYAVAAAKGCAHISRVVLTTDSEEIRSVGLAAGCEAPFLRPAELATDTAKQEDAITQVMDWFEARGESFDLLCLLEPTSPLRTSMTLSRGFELLLQRPDADAVFSVVECDFSPIYCSVLRPDGFMKDWMDEKYKWLNRQELPVFYKPSALVTISRWSAFRERRTFLHDRTLALVVDPIEARDIDTPLDFFIAERLLEEGLLTASDLDEHVRANPTQPATLRSKG